MNKQTVWPLVFFFLFASAGSQIDYLALGWIFFVVSVLVLMGVSWLRHESVKASLVELLILVIAGVVSIVIGKMIAGGLMSVLVGIVLKLFTLLCISLVAWLILPATMRKHWQIF